MDNTNSELKRLGYMFLKNELDEANNMLTRIDSGFIKACNLILNTTGKVIVMGVGKSGHIGRKIASTFASTGTQSFFIYPTEALHGDFGMIDKHDIVILISYSGEANEFRVLLPLLATQGNSVIGITGRNESTLAKGSDALLNISIKQEACPLGLAPTSSALCTLMIGDALALTIMSHKGFSHDQFARSHPAGSLGATLLTTVNDLVEKNLKGVSCSKKHTLFDAVNSLCISGKGLIAITNNKMVEGVFTDGDFRRAIARGANLTDSVGQFMSKNFNYVDVTTKCTHALDTMSKHGITAMPVLNKEQHLIGIINIARINAAGIN